MTKKLTLLRGSTPSSPAPAGETVLTVSDLRSRLLQHLFCYDEARAFTHRIDQMSKPLTTALLLRLLSRGPCYLEDPSGKQHRITAPMLGTLLSKFVSDLRRRTRLLRRLQREVDGLAQTVGQYRPPVPVDWSGVPVYLRTDLIFGLQSGGSVGHIAGVLNHLQDFCRPPVFLTSDAIPTVRPDIETHVIEAPSAFWDFQELPRFHYGRAFAKAAQRILTGRRLAFLYQRYAVNNYSGVVLSRASHVPLVLEYNGSEIWVHRHWGRGFPDRYEALAQKIELLNLHSAVVIVVVSDALRKELVHRGVDDDKILVNPNGVDVERYAPTVDGSLVRQKYGLVGKRVLGFIGTFGRWHGAEVLAQAFGELLKRFPSYRRGVRLLLIGDGVTMPEVKAKLVKYQALDYCICTGLIPQDQGPAHLAACDILVSPHVPNPDGSEFFGSPTKLFEYMAMGKGIVASKLGQIGDVLEHGRTAWMVEPGDAESLMYGLKTLLDDEGFSARLGAAARLTAQSQHTWKKHTERIIKKLQAVSGS